MNLHYKIKYIGISREYPIILLDEKLNIKNLTQTQQKAQNV